MIFASVEDIEYVVPPATNSPTNYPRWVSITMNLSLYTDRLLLNDTHSSNYFHFPGVQ